MQYFRLVRLAKLAKLKPNILPSKRRDDTGSDDHASLCQGYNNGSSDEVSEFLLVLGIGLQHALNRAMLFIK